MTLTPRPASVGEFYFCAHSRVSPTRGCSPGSSKLAPWRHRRPPPERSFFLLKKLIEFVCNLIREQQHEAVGMDTLHVRPNNAFDLSRGDRNPWWLRRCTIFAIAKR